MKRELDSYKRQVCPKPDQIRNPESHMCKKCEGFDAADLRRYAIEMGFPVDANASSRTICRAIFSKLTDNERSLVDKYVSGESLFERQLPGMIPANIRMSVKKPASPQPAAAAPRAQKLPPAPKAPTLPTRREFVPVLEITEDKMRSRLAKQHFLARDGKGFERSLDALDEILAHLPSLLKTLDLEKKQRLMYVKHPTTGELVSKPIGPKELQALAGRVGALMLKNNDDTVGITVHIYDKQGGEHLGRLRIFVEEQQRVIQNEEESLEMAALERIFTKQLVVEEQEQKRARQDYRGDTSTTSWTTGKVKESPTKKYEHGQVLVWYDTSSRTVSIMINGNQVAFYEGVIDVFPYIPQFSLIQLTNQDIVYAGLDHQRLPFVYELTMETGDSIQKIEGDRKLLWATNNIYFLSSGEFLTRQEFEQYSLQKFQGAPFKKFKFKFPK